MLIVAGGLRLAIVSSFFSNLTVMAYGRTLNRRDLSPEEKRYFLEVKGFLGVFG